MSNANAPERIWIVKTNNGFSKGYIENSNENWPQVEYIRKDLHDAALQSCRESESKMREALEAMLRKVNRVTATHRHGQKVSKEMLDDLSNRQIEVENTLRALSTPNEATTPPIDKRQEK